MSGLRGMVIAALLAVWSFPAVSSAKTPAVHAAAPEPRSAAKDSVPPASANDPESTSLAAREQQSRELQDFRGGGVVIYLGSGILLVAVIILIILLV